MFQMTVEDAIKVNDRAVAVNGPCVGRLKFTSDLIDEDGNMYSANIPLDVTLVHDDTKMLLEIIGVTDAKSLIGKTLKSA